MKKERYSSRSIWSTLLTDIRSGRYKDVDKLPPETVLAPELGISRTQLRDGLAILEQDGFITRRRGIGTVINRQVINVKTRIDLADEFKPMLEQAGYRPDMILLSADIITNNPDITKKLEVSPNTPVLALTKVITADERPAIFCVDHIAFSKIKNIDYTYEDLALPVFLFLERFCETDIVINMAELSPIVADEYLSKMLQIQEGDPVLQLDNQAFDIDNNLIMYSRESYADGFFSHTVLRKQI